MMGSMEDLIAFLHVRLDREEQTARRIQATRHGALIVAPGDGESPTVVEISGDRLRREAEADRQLLATYEAAVRRKEASWRNYSAWTNGDPEPYSVLPDGPDEKAIPGLEIAIRIRAARFDRDADYREEWRP